MDPIVLHFAHLLDWVNNHFSSFGDALCLRELVLSLRSCFVLRRRTGEVYVIYEWSASGVVALRVLGCQRGLVE
jgi:hypothetical protein